MKHLDLFSGVGSWALASREVWPDRTMLGFAEIEPFTSHVLKKHFPDVRNYGDITTADLAEHRGLDLLTASPPCQAASAAGQRKGTADPRWLWPRTLELVGELRPRYAILENVPGLLSLNGGVEFEQVCADLEGKGYEVWPLCIPAAGVGAPHRRDRIWIVCHRKEDAQDSFGLGSGGRGENRRQVLGRGGSEVQTPRSDSEVRKGDAGSDATGHRRFGGGQTAPPQTGRKQEPRDAGELSGRLERSCSDTRHPDLTGLEGHGRHDERADERTLGEADREDVADADGSRSYGSQDAESGDAGVQRNPEGPHELRQPQGGHPLRAGAEAFDRSDWNRDWREVATSTCHGRVDDGTAGWVYGPDRISESAHRRERLKALGNGIVGQVAVEIMKAIKECDIIASE